MKKQNLLVGLGAVSAGLIPVLSVVSCNEYVFSAEELELIRDIKITLNEQGKNKTADEFWAEGTNGDWEEVLNKYTNWSDAVAQAISGGLDLQFISIKQIAAGFEINVSINGKADILPLYGFKTNDDTLNEVIKNFKLTVKEASKNKTAEEVEDEYTNSTASTVEKGKALLNNFDIENTEIIVKNGKLVIKSPLYNKEVSLAIQSVSWNSGETDLNKKGTELTIDFEFSYFNEQKNKTSAVQHQVKIAGFASYEQRFNGLVTEFKNNSYISAKLNETLGTKISSAALIEEFNKATTDEARFDVLKANTNIETIPAFDKNANLAYSAKVNQGGLSVDSANDTVVNMLCSFTWKGITKENISLKITQLKSSDKFVNEVEEALISVQLEATPEGRKLTSVDVANKFKENPESLRTYVDLSRMPIFEGITISIKTVKANNQENVPAKEKGSTLMLVASYIYKGIEHEVVLKPVVGFTTFYSIAEKELIDKVNAIELTVENQFTAPESVNENNWKTIVTGIPEENDQYFISNVVINGNNVSGVLTIKFDYNRRFENEVITKTTKEFSFDLISDTAQPSKNFQILKEKMQNDNYFDTIIKEGEQKSNFLSSYFGSSENKTTTDALKNLFDIPVLQGIEFSINGEIRYSKTDSSLSDTQLRIPVVIKNRINPDEVFAKEYVLDGFMDPFGMGSQYIFGTSIRSIIDRKGYDAVMFNNPDYLQYSMVPEVFKHKLPWSNNYATWQTTWLTWGIDYPVSYYMGQNSVIQQNDDLFLTLDRVQNSQTLEYVNFQSVRNFVNHAYKNIFEKDENLKNILSVQWDPFKFTVNEKRFGFHTTFNKDQDGIARADVTSSLTFTSRQRDKHGNQADYNSVTVDNIYFFIYWRNGWWR